MGGAVIWGHTKTETNVYNLYHEEFCLLKYLIGNVIWKQWTNSGLYFDTAYEKVDLHKQCSVIELEPMANLEK